LKIKAFDIRGPLLISLNSYPDNRGFFVERYNEKKFQSEGLPTNFIQDNFSRSAFSVLRGLHFQTNPAQGKLVTCLNGEIFDVAVDIRKDSETYGEHLAVVLKGTEPSWLWIPPGFAHGFCVTSKEGADVFYKVDSAYNPATEGSYHWQSPLLNIQWPILKPILSQKDAEAIEFKK
jgi:dTDP-4-dehydrorhamnose 3,5-epimerase